MAGLIAKLLGGRVQPDASAEPVQGAGGYAVPPGPAGQTGFAGSTSATRTHKGLDQHPAKLPYGSPSGAQLGNDGTVQVQVPPKSGNPRSRNPRLAPRVTVPQDAIRYALQHNSPAEEYGGIPDDVRHGAQTVGGNPLSAAERAGGHSVRDTETPATRTQPVIGTGTPGAENVRNTRAQDYKARPGEVQQYLSSPNPAHGPASPVSVENRFVAFGGGNETWTFDRQMPYTGRGDGARGAALNGERYYATWTGQDEFESASQGSYGIARLRGPNHRPTQFMEPAPWSSDYVDTTVATGTPDNPGPSQVADMTYVSPSVSRGRLNNVRRGG